MSAPPEQSNSPSADASRAAKLTKGTLFAACLSVAIAQLCLTLPAPINGAIQQEFQASGSQLAWVATAFILPTAVLELNFGVIGDIFGRKRLLVLGGLLMAVGNAVNVFSGSIEWLWTGQVIAGIGAAALFPSSLAVIAAGTTEAKPRAKVVARWALSMTAAGALGPLVSGGLATWLSFRWAFVPALVIGLVVAVISQVFVTDSKAPEGRSLDWPGQITVAIALLSVLWAVQEGSEKGFGSAAAIIGFTVAAVFLVLFVLAELRSESPMLRLSLLRIPAFAGSSGVGLIGMFGVVGAGYSLSIRMGAIQHQSPLRIALPFVILGGVSLLLAPVLSRLLHQVSVRSLLVGGLVPMAAGQFWLAFLPITDTSLSSVTGPVFLLGIGLILVITSLTAAAINTVPPHLTGMASASTNLVREFGQTLGAAVISAVAMSSADSVLGSRLDQAGLSAADRAVADGALAHGGPLALVSADFGPATDKIFTAAREALAHGLTTGLIACGVASLIGALIALLVVKPDATARV
ncbi:MFS transporter [Pseudonocardia sp. CA-107938]|uniref:MFS transporter n=1 Tax=Pseudonocardia sp. CA-107938 TaxID=3240021 RepID=UPI003D8C8D0E